MNASELLNSTSSKKFNLLIENVQEFSIRKSFMFATRKVNNFIVFKASCVSNL